MSESILNESLSPVATGPVAAEAGLPDAYDVELDFSEGGVPGSVFQARRALTTTGSPRVPETPGVYAAALTGEVQDILAEWAGVPVHAPQVKTLAARLVSAGVTVTKAAQLLGIHVVTLMSWQGEPEMQAAIAEGAALRRLRLQSAIEDVGLVAIAEVQTVLMSDAPAAVKLRAAELILDRIPATNPGALAAEAKQAPAAAGPVVAITFQERLARVIAAESSESPQGGPAAVVTLPTTGSEGAG